MAKDVGTARTVAQHGGGHGPGHSALCRSSRLHSGQWAADAGPDGARAGTSAAFCWHKLVNNFSVWPGQCPAGYVWLWAGRVPDRRLGRTFTAAGLGVPGDVEAVLPQAPAQVRGGQLRGAGRAGRGQVARRFDATAVSRVIQHRSTQSPGHNRPAELGLHWIYTSACPDACRASHAFLLAG